MVGTYKKKRDATAKRKLRLRNRLYIYHYLEAHCCVECGESRPVCLEFHHRDPDSKHFEPWISVGRDVSIKRLITEISKCDVVCANCHRVITSKQQWRYSFLNYPEANE